MANLRWLWSHITRAKWLLLLATILMSAEAFFNLAAIGLQQTMIDEVMYDRQTDRFWPILIQIAIAYLIYSMMFTIGPHVIHLVFARMRTSMGKELMRSIQRIPLSKLQSERTAGYVYHFSNDMYTTSVLAAGDIPRTVQKLVSLVMIVVIIALASPKLLAVMVIMVLMYLLLGRFFGQRRKKAASEVSRYKSDLLVHLEEGVSSTREVIAFHRQDWESSNYQRKFRAYYDSVMRENKLINKELLFSDPLKWGMLLFVLLYCGYLVLDNQLTVGMFVVIYQFTTRFTDALGGMFQFVMTLNSRMASIERIRGVLEGEKIEDGTEPLKEPITSIRFDHVAFHYDQQPVLNHINLTIPAGKKTAFVGSSGGGKSTIASLLVRFFDPVEGEIYINGRKLRDLRRSEWMNRIMLVFQEPYLLPDTIRANILLGVEDMTEERMREVCHAMQIDDFIMSLPEGYDTMIGERGVTLSGGQRQRLSLARAILRNTEVLILDEATSSLDLETERRVQENLDQLRKGRTTIIIAHRLSTIQNSDLIFVMNQGTVAEQGTHEELLENRSIYSSLVNKVSRAQMLSV